MILTSPRLTELLSVENLEQFLIDTITFLKVNINKEMIKLRIYLFELQFTIDLTNKSMISSTNHLHNTFNEESIRFNQYGSSSSLTCPQRQSQTIFHI